MFPPFSLTVKEGPVGVRFLIFHRVRTGRTPEQKEGRVSREMMRRGMAT